MAATLPLYTAHFKTGWRGCHSLNASPEVLQVCGTYGSFAAVKQDGTVMTWGKDSTGGDSSSVQPVVMPDLDED